MKEEYVVLYNNKVWSDRFDSIEDCKCHIEKCIEEDKMDSELFEYREMTKAEILEYN